MDYDVVIIGASVAGATAAHLLGRAGLTVGLFDKTDFPRRKPCGEGLARPGIKILARLGLEHVLDQTPHLPFSGYKLQSHTRSSILTTPESGGVTLERQSFDAHLLDAALTNKTVTKHLSERVNSVAPSGEIVTDRRNYRARYILLAAGANSPLTKELGLYCPRSGGQRMGVTATFKGSFNSVLKHVHITITPHFETYATPLPDGKLNISLLAPFPSTVNVREILLSPQVVAPISAAMGFTGELSLPPIGRAPLGHQAPLSYHENLLLIGDTAEEFDPIGGMGMTHALRSAELAAAAILSVISEHEVQADAWARYHTAREQSAKKIRSFTALSYYTLRSAAKVPLLIDLAGSAIGRRVSRYFSSFEGVL